MRLRLIDADKELEKLNEMEVSGEVFSTAVEFAKSILQDAPTVDKRLVRISGDNMLSVAHLLSNTYNVEQLEELIYYLDGFIIYNPEFKNAMNNNPTEDSELIKAAKRNYGRREK